MQISQTETIIAYRDGSGRIRRRPVLLPEWIRDDFQPEPPEASTDTLPGTSGRISVYRRRVSAGQELHHPGDRNRHDAVA